MLNKRILVLIYLTVIIVALGLIVAGCLPTVPPVEQDEPGSLTKAGGITWYVPDNFATIQEAIDRQDVIAGDKIIVGPGEWFGAVVTKAVEIKGEKGAVIVDGPAHPTHTHLHIGFKLGYGEGGSVATISHFTFRGGEIGNTGQYLAFPVFALEAHDVTVEHNVMIDPIQGVTNWNGSGWVIRHNEVTGLWDFGGGGLAIFIGAEVGYPPTTDNLVAFNKIIGDFPEERNYSVAGICLLTYGGEVTGNKVVHNDVLITGDDTYAIVMAFLPSEQATPHGIFPEDVLYDNKIGFNDLRGSNVGIGYILESPDDNTGYLSVPADEARELMEGCNLISRNLGDNRAYDGTPANEFKPVAEE